MKFVGFIVGFFFVNSLATTRRQKLDERDAYLIDLIKDGVPLTIMAKMVGTHRDYCGDIVQRLCREHGLTYAPTPEGEKDLPLGISDQSRPLRAHLGNLIYNLREVDHHLQIAIDTGLTNKAQRKARDHPFAHDWTLGQMERLAKRLNKTFREMMLEALLTEEEWVCIRKT